MISDGWKCVIVARSFKHLKPLPGVTPAKIFTLTVVVVVVESTN